MLSSHVRKDKILYLDATKRTHMKKILFALAAVSAITVSCKKDLEPQEPLYTAKDTATGATPAVAAAPANVQQVQAGQTMQVTPQQVAPAKTAAGMNPAHGQPGHRCDIAVGAPLSAPVANTTPSIKKSGSATVQPINPGATASTPAKTAPGMNPPHGQPNHRCDIAVGAPLNSPKKEAASPAAPVQTTPAILAVPEGETKG
jgi:hypothetical protein